MIPFEMLLLPHVPLRGRILSKSNSAGNSDCFRVCFHLHFNDREILEIRLFAARLLKRKGEKKFTCNHLTFALCKQRQELGIANNFLRENALCPFLLPGQEGLRWAEMGSQALLPWRGFAPVQRRGAGTPGGLGAGEGDVARRGERPGALCSARLDAGGRGCWGPLQERSAPAGGGGKGSKTCPGLSACLGQRSGGFSRRDSPCGSRAPSREVAALSTSPAARGSSHEAQGSRPPRENSWE